MNSITHQHLIQTLTNCVIACNHCAGACLKEADIKMLAACIQLDLDCADICAVTATLIARGSRHGQHLLKECAEICTACTAECEQHAKHGMEHCRACAAACRQCAEECLQAAA